MSKFNIPTIVAFTVRSLLLVAGCWALSWWIVYTQKLPWIAATQDEVGRKGGENMPEGQAPQGYVYDYFREALEPTVHRLWLGLVVAWLVLRWLIYPCLRALSDRALARSAPADTLR